MQTSFSNEFLATADGKRVNEILRNCVHCGFCNATCPTYQLTGDELDGPRGRIYLIKNFFEDQKNISISTKHLDRCLTCLACETTCPSGVEYGDLIDIGRKHIESHAQRNLQTKLKRKLIVKIFSRPSFTSIVLNVARHLKTLLPKSLVIKLPVKVKANIPKSLNMTSRKMLTISGCVQAAAAPQINATAAYVLNKSNIQLVDAQSECCGALAFHLTDLNKAKTTIRKNIEKWYEKLLDGYEYLVITSSGCSVFIKQYSTIMQDEKDYAEKANLVSERCKDLAEMTAEMKTGVSPKQQTIAFHSPCTLQHGQKIIGNIERKLEDAGYKVILPKDAHLCCGSAGSYSLLEPNFSAQLLKNKLDNLLEQQPDVIATANIGCLLHLQSGTEIPVKHWVELLT